MLYEFKLPDIGEGVVEGEVVRWLVHEGDLVREDQPMVEVMTDKATVEIPAPRAGRVARRMYAEGQLCPVGKVLITIDTDAAAAAVEPAPVAKAAAAAAAPTAVAAAPVATHAPATITALHPATAPAAVAAPRAGNNGAPSGPVLATPATRKLARDLGVDIRLVTGTGRAGRITSDDVREHQARPAAAPAAAHAPAVIAREAGDVRVPFRGVRKKIAEHLVQSKHTAAHFTYVEEVDATDLVVLRARANERMADKKLKLSYLPFIIKATVAALKRYPQLNASLDEAAGELVQRGAYHIGLAAATAQGLLVPVVRDADKRSVIELAREIDRLAEATRAGKVAREDLVGSTFTITSLGALGGLHATPIINYPEVAILGVHKIARRPVVRGSEIAIRDMMNLSISVDHRCVDGYEAALFVAEIKQTLETPGLLFLDSV